MNVEQQRMRLYKRVAIITHLQIYGASTNKTLLKVCPGRTVRKQLTTLKNLGLIYIKRDTIDYGGEYVLYEHTVNLVHGKTRQINQYLRQWQKDIIQLEGTVTHE